MSFLELQDENISNDWFHKETWSGRYLNFVSHLPFSYKRNTVTLLSKKVFELSNSRFHDKNIKNLKNELLVNQYPGSFLNKSILRRTKFCRGRVSFHSQVDNRQAIKIFVSKIRVTGLWPQNSDNNKILYVHRILLSHLCWWDLKKKQSQNINLLKIEIHFIFAFLPSVTIENVKAIKQLFGEKGVFLHAIVVGVNEANNQLILKKQL
jgi:hypothetical protein